MNGHETNWLPGILVLATGAVAALVYLFSAKNPQVADKKAAPATPAVDPVEELNAKYQRLLGELKEHRANKHLMPADAWAAEQARLEQAAAAALRERDGVKHEADKAHARLEKKAQDAAKDTGFFARNPAVTGALIGGAVVAFFAYLGVSVSSSSSQRQDGMSATGGPGPAGAMGRQPEPPPMADPQLEALAARVQSNPDDVDAVADLGLRLISLQGFADAKPLMARTALLDPFHVKGRVGRAVLRAVDGDVPGAQAELERLAASYPEAYDGHLYAGLLALEQNDPRRAVAQLEQYVNTAPASEQPPMIRAEVERMKAELAGGGGPPMMPR